VATPTWRTREVPILEATAQLTVEHQWVRHSSEIASATGLTDEDVALGIARLAEAEYVRFGSQLHHPGGGRSYTGVGLLERGLREVGIWPNEDVAGTFETVIDERIELASDPEQRSRLKSFRDAALAVGQEVVAGVLTEAVKRAAMGI
jgi:hypothetical protein